MKFLMETPFVDEPVEMVFVWLLWLTERGEVAGKRCVMEEGRKKKVSPTIPISVNGP